MQKTRLVGVQRAFFRLGWLDLISYPSAFVLTQLDQVIGLAIQYFVSQLVEPTPVVGNDFYTFIVIGIMVHRILATGLAGFGHQMDAAITQGRLEALLVEPLPWRLLPFGMVQFQTVTRLATTVVMVSVSLAFGARYELAGVIPALLITALGFMCVLAIGILGTSVKVLSKRSDPILSLYTLVTALFAGVYFPIDLLPGLIRPVAYLLPQTYILSSVRKLLMEDGSGIAGPGIWVSVGVLALMCAVLYPIALAVYGRAMDTGRRLGILAGY